MKRKIMGSYRAFAFALALFLAALALPALADDAEQLKHLPGEWVYLASREEESSLLTERLAFLTLRTDGHASLCLYRSDGEYAYTCDGTWRAEYVADGMDRLALSFTATDDPKYAQGGYSMECVYEIYTETWDENDLHCTYLSLENAGGADASPFADVYGEECEWSVGLFREQGPNMRVVNCQSYVSLRAKRSASSSRRAKVPLGALVLAFPEEGDENGFLYCLYRGEYGYILSEYLEPVE